MNDGAHGGGHVGGGHHGGGHHGYSGHTDPAVASARGNRRGRRTFPVAARILLSVLFGVAIAVGSVWLGQLLHH